MTLNRVPCGSVAAMKTFELSSRMRRLLTSATLLLVAVGIYRRFGAGKADDEDDDTQAIAPPPLLPGQKWVFLKATLKPTPESASVAKPLDAGGSAQITLNLQPLRLEWEAFFGSLSGPPTALGFYKAPVMPQSPALLVIPLESLQIRQDDGPLRYVARGNADLTPAQAVDVQCRRWVLVVSTAAFVGGELAGRVRIKAPGVGGV